MAILRGQLHKEVITIKQMAARILLLTAITILEHRNSVAARFSMVILILCLLFRGRLDWVMHVPGSKPHLIMHLCHKEQFA